MWIENSKEIDEKKSKFLKMSEEEFDKYMCKTYPIMFKERNLPKNQTCMCWGLNIGKGWQWILADLCEKLEFISGKSGINVVFKQIKEKFGGARFYYGYETEKGKSKSKNSPSDVKYWGDIIENTISHSEELCDYYCAECGEQKDDIITLGGWCYDTCEKCLEKKREDGIKWWREYKELKELAIDVAYRGNKEEIKQLKKVVKGFSSRTNKEQKKQQKKYDKMYKDAEKKLAKEKVVKKD